MNNNTKFDKDGFRIERIIFQGIIWNVTLDCGHTNHILNYLDSNGEHDYILFDDDDIEAAELSYDDNEEYSLLMVWVHQLEKGEVLDLVYCDTSDDADIDDDELMFQVSYHVTEEEIEAAS